MDELSQTEIKVLRLLIDSGGKLSLEEIARKSGLADSAIARAILALSEKRMVKEHVEKTTELKLTEEGKIFAEKSLPERIVASIVYEAGGQMKLREALHKAGLAENYGPIVTGWIAKKRWGKIQKSDSEIQIIIDGQPKKGDDEELLERLRQGKAKLESLPPNSRGVAEELVRRRIVESRPKSEREVEITSSGRSITLTEPTREEVSFLTGEMIVSGEWEKTLLRSYNVSSPVPATFPGKYHPYTRFLRSVKEKLVALGFQEVAGPIVETAFVNCDCLFMPQDHPAREIHDLYYLKDPSRTSLKIYGNIVERVAKTHENGWKTGSKGWGYKYSLDEASRLILRSHGTTLSARTLMSKQLQIPGKYFAIARCFRPDLLDRTHLTEFNQAEGIILDSSLNLRNLLGILEMFAKEVAGADKVRYKPDYFPFTEPSIELQAYKEGYGWMEFGGSGILRPEVTKPLGVDIPVLAWGLGIDRLYMMKRAIQDIRQLFTSDLQWIRIQPVR